MDKLRRSVNTNPALGQTFPSAEPMRGSPGAVKCYCCGRADLQRLFVQRGPNAGLAPVGQGRVKGTVTVLLPFGANPADEIPKLLFKIMTVTIITMITATGTVTILGFF